MSLEGVKKDILSMSLDEKKRLFAILQHELKQSGRSLPQTHAAASTKEVHKELFYDVVSGYLEAVYGMKKIPYKVAMANKMLSRSVSTAFKNIEDFLAAAKVEKLRRPQRIWLYDLYAKLIDSGCRARNIDVRYETLFRFSNRFHSQIEEVYPGYIENGLLFRVFSADRTNPKDHQ